MKDLKILVVFTLMIAIVLILNSGKHHNTLKMGCISFVSMNSHNNDGFEILTNEDIPPKTKIRFTDSEWNGNRFGFDENDVLWVTGDEYIKANTVINFINLNSNASVSIGTISGSMRLSKKQDAIFAYVGGKRMPTKFLAAITNNKLGYGTLVNTGLVHGETALIIQ